MEQLSQDRMLVESVWDFYYRFYCFPNILNVQGVIYTREEIIATIEKYLNGRPLQWYRRRKLIGQLKDALRELRNE